jgi:hypothetical protein
MSLALGARMGLDYSFELVVEIAKLERALVAIADALVPSDRERLLRSVAPDPVGWLERIERTGTDARMSDVCFSFLFSPDDDLLVYPSGQVEPCGRVGVGCVWCYLRIRDDGVAVFRATAATTCMSLLFERSESVRAVWASIAEQCGAWFVMFDDETYENRVLWPYVGTLSDLHADEEPQSRPSWPELAARAQRLAGRAGA